MNMRRLIYIAFFIISMGAYPYDAQQRPLATLKVEYEAWSNSTNTITGEPSFYSDKFILQVAKDMSYYFNAQTYFVDSLQNDPNGKAALTLAWEDAYREMVDGGRNSYEIMKEKGFVRKSSAKHLKNFNFGIIDVWDSNMGDDYNYKVEMSDLSWEICDSIIDVLGYECNLATTDYHGRKWKAWFATDIPVRDGPWQLCGLPGLIMRAETDDISYGFTATGIQKCNEPLKERYINEDKVFKTQRKAFLKTKDYSRRNRSAQISAMTGGKVNPTSSDYKDNDDFIETDYHE